MHTPAQSLGHDETVSPMRTLQKPSVTHRPVEAGQSFLHETEFSPMSGSQEPFSLHAKQSTKHVFADSPGSHTLFPQRGIEKFVPGFDVTTFEIRSAILLISPALSIADPTRSGPTNGETKTKKKILEPSPTKTMNVSIWFKDNFVSAGKRLPNPM
ncbi:MAG: hypothetical protein J4215_05060 [Candidatus Diapherotrites archaeon]|uniref:Uncharacterized protein n=1 Tax=Candidatus Iainarchaeum sp. TaxID=3101447 RepID=A0A8T4L3L3_9ARCH|nr:hypothetical protein [Candidatus Diapherotrites archaeon]